MNRSDRKWDYRYTQMRFVILIITCIGLLLPLAAYAWGGSFMRYSGDDYCYGKELVNRGFLSNQIFSYSHTMEYNGNRYSLTLLSNIGDLFGAVAGAAMPGLAIAFWVAGIFLMLGEAAKSLRLKMDWLIRICLAEFLVFMCLYLAPLLIQVLFWRSAMLTYLAPVICLVWVIWLCLRYGNFEQGMIYLLPGICFLSFLSAGFSETGAVLQSVTFIFALVGIALFWKQDLLHRRRALLACSMALLGVLVGMLFLLFSPSNAGRIGDYPHPGLPQLISLTLTHGFTFMIESLKGYPLPSLVTLAFSAAIAMEVASQYPNNKNGLKKWLIVCGLIIIVSYILVAATAAPSVLARSAYPEPRAWMPGRSAMTAGLILFGISAGMFFRGVVKPTKTFHLVITGVILLGVGAYALRAVPRIVTEVQPLHAWAVGWDARDQAIRNAIDAGETEMVVQRLPMIIQWVNELTDDPHAWYNECAAGWYGVDSISAMWEP
jgi:hypothetical protein